MLAVALRSDGPSEAVLTELVDNSADKPKVLEQMWRSGNVTAREFVTDYLKLHVFKEPALIRQMQGVIAQAARDPDVTAREPALNILAKHKDPATLALLRGQLNDADPAVRVMALQSLREIADSNDVPAAIRLLDDSDPRVIVQAASLLRQVTDFESGIRTADALPNFVGTEDGTPLPEPNLEKIQRGVQRWRGWWSSNRLEFAGSLTPTQVSADALPLKDFALENLDGKPAHLSDFRGKAVLLCFWKIGDVRTSDDLTTLKQLQEKESQRLAVVGVAFDSAVGPQEICDEGDEGEPHHDHAHMSGMNMNGMSMTNMAGSAPMSLHCAVNDLMASAKIQFPVLLDKTGTTAYRFNVQEMPTYVLIDADGNLRRRFVGSRDLTVLQAMANESRATAVIAQLNR